MSRKTIALLVLLCAGLFPHTAAGQASTGPATDSADGAGQVVATGVVPDAQTKRSILGRLQALYGRDRVVDELRIADVRAPDDWGQRVQSMLVPELRGVSPGELFINGNEVQVKGAVSHPDGREQLLEHMAGALDSSYHISHALTVRAQQQDQVDAALDNRIVEFQSGSARLTDAGSRLLEEMLPTLMALEAQQLDIIGHTDNRGTRAANVALSAARAETVKHYLVTRGMDADRITSLGAGEQRPIASNESPEGRARNRRIEFRLRATR